MLNRNIFVVLCIFLPFGASAADSEQILGDGKESTVVAGKQDSSENTPKRSSVFADLVRLQGDAAVAKIEAEIRASRNSGSAVSRNQEIPSNANPLLNANQRLVSSEPTLEAIWGMAGREVAEINYKGKRYALNRLKPEIPGGDEWFLEDIKPYQVTLVKKKSGKVQMRKNISLNWQGNIGGAIDYMGKSVPSISGLNN